MFTSSAWKFSTKGAQTVTPVSRSRLVPVLNFIQHWAIWARLMMCTCRYILHWSSRWQQQVHVTGSIYLTALQTKMKPCPGSAWFNNEQCLWKEKKKKKGASMRVLFTPHHWWLFTPHHWWLFTPHNWWLFTPHNWWLFTSYYWWLFTPHHWLFTPHNWWLFTSYYWWLFTPHNWRLFTSYYWWLFTPHHWWLFTPHNWWLFTPHNWCLSTPHNWWLVTPHNWWLSIPHNWWLYIARSSLAKRQRGNPMTLKKSPCTFSTRVPPIAWIP